MSNERYDDQVLSAIIDDDADAETVASVIADPAARARLEHMRQAVSMVAEPTPEATPERRSASIAAAMAAATSAPEVTSLAAARHVKTEQAKSRRSMPRAWIGAAAAAVMFVIAVPIALSLTSGSDTTDTAGESTGSLSIDADTSADAVDDAVDAVDDASEEAMADMATSDNDAMSDDAMDEAAMSDDGAMDDDVEDVLGAPDDADDAAEAPADAPSTTTVPASATVPDTKNLFTANNVDVLNDFVQLGSIVGHLTAGELVIAGVNPDCVRASDDVTGETPYALVNLDHFGGSPRLAIVEFADDGSTRVLDAEDCALLG